MLREVINEHKWDFCQLQINYLDWEVVNADELYQIADEAKVPIIVMEPLRGGVLCNLPQKAVDKLKSECPNETQASFGLRWVAGRKRVFTILSGISNFQQLKENVDTFVNYKEITQKEEKLAHEIAQIIQSRGAINCTACKYCLEVCPTGAIKRLSLTEKQKTRIAMAMIKEDLCTKCGICEKACPYGAIIKSDGKTIVNASKCIGCGACKAACRFNVIEIFAIKKTGFNIIRRK